VTSTFQRNSSNLSIQLVSVIIIKNCNIVIKLFIIKSKIIFTNPDYLLLKFTEKNLKDTIVFTIILGKITS